MGMFGKYMEDPDEVKEGRNSLPLMDKAGRLQTVVSGVPIGFETLTVNTVAKSLSPTTDENGNVIATQAEITIETADIRVRSDGTDPTATVGHLIVEGTVISLTSVLDINSFRAIRDASTDAVLSITYLR